MKQVTEEMNPQIEWFERARSIETIEEFSAFAKELLEETEHDYGTVCHAIGALAIAAGWMGSHIQGITGFQAGFVMWDFIKQWNFRTNKCGLRIINYDDMLYPQFRDEFEKTLPADRFKIMQKVAAEHLANGKMHPAVEQHMRNIVAGVVPFGYTLTDEE